MRVFILLLSLSCYACVNQPLKPNNTNPVELGCNERQAIDSGLSNCNDQENTHIPSLSIVIPQLKKGMTLTEVNTLLAGRKPYLRYTLPSNNHAIWEFDERSGLSNNSINHNRLIINFDNKAKVNAIISSQCLLPDLVLNYKLSSASSCYEKQLYPFNAPTVYDAVKQLLITSNYHIDHSDAASLIISAIGVQSMDEDSNKMMFIKLTTIFKPAPNGTEVIVSASFNVSEKQSTWVHAGFAGVTLPIPLPFQEKAEWIYTGIVTPRFYLNFYDTLSALIAREFLAYKEAETLTASSKKELHPKPIVTRSLGHVIPDEIKYSVKKSVISNNTENNLIEPEIKRLPAKFDGAMDNDSNLQKLYKEDAEHKQWQTNDVDQLDNEPVLDLFNLHGQALDSEKVLKLRR